MNRYGQSLALAGGKHTDQLGMATANRRDLESETAQNTDNLSGSETPQARHQAVKAAVS